MVQFGSKASIVKEPYSWYGECEAQSFGSKSAVLQVSPTQ